MSLMPIPEIDTCEQIAEISSAYISKVKKKGLTVCSTGGSLRGGVKKIQLSFRKYGLVDVLEARKIYMDIAEGLIKEINQDKIIRPYLHDYPCTNRNINLMISFEDYNRSYPPNNYVALVCVAHGVLYYSIYDRVKDDFIDIYKEPYEEALKIVRQEIKLPFIIK